MIASVATDMRSAVADRTARSNSPWSEYTDRVGSGTRKCGASIPGTPSDRRITLDLPWNSGRPARRAMRPDGSYTPVCTPASAVV